MRILFVFITALSLLPASAQLQWQSLLNKSMAYHFSRKSGVIEITSAEKNVLKSDTNHYKQDFLFSIDSQKVGKLFYSEGDGFSIYVNNTTYYVYTYNNTYYIGENSSFNHLKFLPYWDPGSFFFEYMAMGKKNGVSFENREKEKQFVLRFTNKDGGRFSLYFDHDTYRLRKYTGIYTHKKYGDQYKEFYFMEKEQINSSIRDSILKDLDEITKVYIQTTDDMIKNAEKEYEKRKKKIIGSKVDIAGLWETLKGVSKNQTGSYILLDYFYQACLPCLKGISELNELRGKVDTGKLLIVGIDPLPIDVGHKERFIKKYNISYPILDGEQAISVKNISLAGLSVRYPTLVLISPDGKIAKILDSYSPAHFRELNAYFKEVF